MQFFLVNLCCILDANLRKNSKEILPLIKVYSSQPNKKVMVFVKPKFVN